MTTTRSPGTAPGRSPGRAGLCGATGIRADCRDQLDPAMTRLFAADGPAMLHVSQDPELL